MGLLDDLCLSPVNFSRILDYRFQQLKLFKQQNKQLRMMNEHAKTITILPRGASKSFSFSLYALFKFVTHPPTRVAFFSLSQRQANKSLDTASDIINSTETLRAARQSFLIDQKQRLKSHAYGEIVALPHDPSTILGEHPDVLLLDECQDYTSDDIYKKILKPMLTGVQTTFQIPEIHLAFVAGESDGFSYNMYTHAEELGFKVLKQNWTQCEGYNPEEITKLRREMGEKYYLTQLMSEFIPATSSPFPFDLIQRNIGRLDHVSSAPSSGGIDIAKKRDQACIVVGQLRGQKIQVLDLFLGQYDYTALAREAKSFAEAYRTSSFLVDTTSGEEFVDFGRKPPYAVPLKPFNFAGGRKNALIDFLHIQMEQGNIIIPDPITPNTFKFQDLISALRNYRTFLHLPDAMAALALMVWNIKKEVGVDRQLYWDPMSA